MQIKQMEQIKEQLENLFLFCSPNISNKEIYNDINSEIQAITSDDSEKNLELISSSYLKMNYLISQSEKDDNLKSLSIKNFDLGKLNREILMAGNMYFNKMNSGLKPNIDKILPKCAKLFSQINTEFLMPSDIIENKADGKIVEIVIPNCNNIIYNTVPVIDTKYVEEHYSDLNPNSGVCKKILERFQTIVQFPNLVPTNGLHMIKSMDKKVYQKLADGKYRELKQYSDRDFAKNIDNIELNMYIVNWENKQICSQIRNYQLPKQPVNNAILGKIKNNIDQHRMRISDAVFNAYYTPAMSDEEVLSKLAYSYSLDNSIKRKDAKAYFSEYKNIKNIR